jgi:hypothetical protein
MRLITRELVIKPSMTTSVRARPPSVIRRGLVTGWLISTPLNHP